MQDEQNFQRYATYSMWHRWRSAVRYLHNPDVARSLGMIDLDNTVWIEWRNKTFEPLALIETARDSESEKSGAVLSRLGELSSLPSYIVRYVLAGYPNKAYPQVEDIARFRVKRVCPDPERGYREMMPQQYAEWLVQLREHQTRSFLRQQGWELHL